MTEGSSLIAALGDRYRLEGEIGSGGMAIVYRAIDRKHDRPVALKVMRPEIAAAMGRERFLSEISIAAKLQHPHIISLIDSGDADGMGAEAQFRQPSGVVVDVLETAADELIDL